MGSSEKRDLSLRVHDSAINRLSHHANSTGRSVTTVKRVERRPQNVRKRIISSVITKLIWSSPLNLCMIRDTLWGLSLRPFIQSQTYWNHFDWERHLVVLIEPRTSNSYRSMHFTQSLSRVSTYSTESDKRQSCHCTQLNTVNNCSCTSAPEGCELLSSN